MNRMSLFTGILFFVFITVTNVFVSNENDKFETKRFKATQSPVQIISGSNNVTVDQGPAIVVGQDQTGKIPHRPSSVDLAAFCEHFGPSHTDPWHRNTPLDDKHRVSGVDAMHRASTVDAMHRASSLDALLLVGSGSGNLPRGASFNQDPLAASLTAFSLSSPRRVKQVVVYVEDSTQNQ